MVPARSHEIPRASWYSGFTLLGRVFAYGVLTFYDWPSHAILLTFTCVMSVQTPARGLVWALPSSLAATGGIEFSFFSSRYLDVSVP